MVDFGLSARVTRMVLDLDQDGVSYLAEFTIRRTTVYAQSQKLVLAQIPKKVPIKKDNNIIELEEEVLYLSKGQIIAITGETVDEDNNPTGFTQSEIAIIAGTDVIDGHTRITLERNLQNSYKRVGAILNANAARADHGQSKKDLVQAGGDPSKYLQEFIIREKPLTYVSASTQTGVSSTLKLFVDNIQWKEVQSLYSLGINDRAYVTRMDDEFQTHILFGDGIKGMRPSAGLDNIRSKYRIGIGKEGILKANQLTILLDRPMGVKGVTNPISTFGASDPENVDDTRNKAPLTVLTMGRIVSLSDFEDFARAFAGIAKAQAAWIWDGGQKVVYLTILSETGTSVDPTSDLYKNLVDAIDTFKDPEARFQIVAPLLKEFTLSAGILVSDGYHFEEVKLRLIETLKKEFSFAKRQFGQPVSLGEIFSVIQAVAGVEATDIDNLFLIGDTAMLNKLIPSHIAYWDDIGKKVVSAELTNDKYCTRDTRNSN